MIKGHGGKFIVFSHDGSIQESFKDYKEAMEFYDAMVEMFPEFKFDIMSIIS